MLDGSDAMGAEATVCRTTFLGRDAIVKSRPSKSYRIAELDRHLRSTRTRNEARLLREARLAGVRTPCLYDVDMDSCAITMERVSGYTVKEELDNHPEAADDICRELGAMIARLHSAGVCHGDLTTSNMILDDNGSICIIDFSMGCTKASLEDIGVDLRLLERAFSSAHTNLQGSFDILMESYYSNMSNPEQIQKKVMEIKNRGRYT